MMNKILQNHGPPPCLGALSSCLVCLSLRPALSAGKIDVEIKPLELEYQAHEQQREQECQLKMKELELQEKEPEMKDRDTAAIEIEKVRATEGGAKSF